MVVHESHASMSTGSGGVHRENKHR
jgi:hypothetical protein